MAKIQVNAVLTYVPAQQDGFTQVQAHYVARSEGEYATEGKATKEYLAINALQEAVQALYNAQRAEAEQLNWFTDVEVTVTQRVNYKQDELDKLAAQEEYRRKQAEEQAAKAAAFAAFKAEVEKEMGCKPAYRVWELDGYDAITVGTYGDKKRFPRLKAGGFNYSKIKAELQVRAEREAASAKAEKERATKRNACKQAHADLAAMYAISEYYGPLQVDGQNLKLEVYVTKEQAARLLAVLEDEGLVKRKEQVEAAAE